MNWSYKFLLIVFVAVMCVVDVVWIHLNTAPPRMFDDATYLTESVDLYHTLQQEGLSRFLNDSLTHSRAGHPPMMKIFPVPFFLLSGPGVNAALYGYVFLIPVFCLYLFLMVKALVNNEKVAVLAVIVTCLFPLTYGLWRNLMAEFGMALATIASLYHMLKSSEFRIKRHVVLAGLFVGWGTLWKVSFPLFVAGPLIYLLIRRLRSTESVQWRSLVLSMTLLALAVCLVAGPFWVRSNRPVVDFLVFSIQENTHNQTWSLGPVFSPRTVLHYWLNHINVGISVYFLALIPAGLVLYRRPARELFSAHAWWFLLTWFLPPFLVMSFQVLKEIRHVYPVYPAIAILVGTMLANLPVRTLAVLALFPGYLFMASSFDLPALPRRDLHVGPFVLMTKDLEKASLDLMAVYTYPANPLKLPIEETVKAIAERSAQNSLEQPRIRVTGSSPYFNGVTFDLYSRIQRLPLRFENHFNTSISKADFVVTLSSPATYVERLLADQRLPFVPILSIGEVRVYEKTKGLSGPWVRPWTKMVDESTAPTEKSSARFEYIYIPDSGASLQFFVKNEEIVPNKCVWTWQVSVREMDVDAQPRIVQSGTAGGVQRENVNLNTFEGNIVEIALTSTAAASNAAACRAFEFGDIRMDYGYPTDYHIQVQPVEVIAGKDSYVLAIVGLSNVVVDIQYTLNGSPTPQTFTTGLDAQGRAKFEVASSTRKGDYKFIGFKIPGLSMWIPADAGVIVR